MRQSKLKSILALAVFAVALSGMTAAYGQYQITGTTPEGGNIVIGNGFLGRLASGASTGFLTSGGGDHLTLNLGSFTTTDSYGATIKFGTPNDILVNNGTIQNNGYGDGTDLGNAVSFLSNDFLYNGDLGTFNITNETVTNHGSMFGGSDFDDAEIIGNGLSFLANEEIDGVTVTNTGFLEGGSYDYFAFIAGSGLSFASEDSYIANITVDNSGVLMGGNENDDATVLSTGLSIAASNGVYNVSITNEQGGNILGGNFSFGDEGTIGIGNGISIIDEDNFLRDINNVIIHNSGNITGGNDNFSDTEFFDSGFLISNAIAIGGFGPVSDITITNSSTGLIQGGNDSDDGWFIGNGVVIGSLNQQLDGASVQLEEQQLVGSVDNVNISNDGLIQGGHGNFSDIESGLTMGDGIAIFSSSGVSNVTINNGAGGKILGGDDNSEADESAGTGISISSFFENFNPEVVPNIPPPLDGFNVSNVTINNSGLIAGGSGNGEAFYVGMGIGIDADDAIQNVTINNALGATIAGGDGNYEYSFDTGAGIAFDSNSIYGVTVNNAGLIRGGNDIDDGEGDSYGGDGIDVFANNISNVTVNNAFTGVIQGGLGGGDGIFIDGEGDPANVVVNNAGVIEGGNGDGLGDNPDAGYGIEFIGSEESYNIQINNFGWILGGNGDGQGSGGAGISINGDNTTTNNWGIIAAGENSGEFNVGFVKAAIINVGGNLADAIVIEGAGNVLNLNGHSAVYGKISIDGPENSNTVNLNFTGVDVATLNALNAQLQAQGADSGSDTNVEFTLRGVTYDIDPAMINGHLLSYQLQGITPNQSAIGASLDSAKVNPTPGTPLFNLYNAIDLSGNVPHAIEELSPQPYQIYDDIALANANLFSLTIDNRLNNLRDGSEGIDVSGFGGDNTMGLTSGLSKEDGKGGKSVITPAPGPENRWGFFADGNAIFTNIDGHGGDLQNAGFTTEGLMLGVDGKIYEKWLVGAFFDYEHTNADLDAQGSSADIDSYTGGLYASYHDGSYFGNALVGYTHNEYTSQRNIVIPGFVQSAAGSTSGDQFELNLDGGYDIHVSDRLTWGPIAGMQYVHLNVDGFSEIGAPAANLAIGSQDVDSLRSRLGLRVDYHKQISKKMTFATEARAEWQHEFLDDSRGIGANFIGDGLVPFSVQTTSPQRDAALVGLGANVTVKNKYTFFFDYDLQAGQDSYLEHSVKGGLKISW